MMTEERTIDLVLNLHKKILIDRQTNLSHLKQISREIFGQIADDFLFFINDQEITDNKMNILRTVNYYHNESIVLVPILPNVELISSIENYSQLGNNNFSLEEYERHIRDNEMYRKNISRACVDLEELKKNIMSLKVRNEDLDRSKASLIMKKAEDIISDSNFLLEKYNTEVNPNRTPSSKSLIQNNSYFNNLYKKKKIQTYIRDYNSNPNESFLSNKSTKTNKTNGIPITFSRNTSHTRVPSDNTYSNKTAININQTEINLLRDENEYLKDTIDVLNRKLNDLQQKMSIYVEEKKGVMNDKFEVLNEKLKNSEDRVKSLQENLEELEKMNNNLDCENNNLLEKICLMEQEIRTKDQNLEGNKEYFVQEINSIKERYEKELEHLNFEKNAIIDDLKNKISGNVKNDFTYTLNPAETERKDENRLLTLYDRFKEDLKNLFNYKFNDNNSVNVNLIKLNEYLNHKLIELIDEIQKLNEKLCEMNKENLILSEKIQGLKKVDEIEFNRLKEDNKLLEEKLKKYKSSCVNNDQNSKNIYPNQIIPTLSTLPTNNNNISVKEGNISNNRENIQVNNNKNYNLVYGMTESVELIGFNPQISVKKSRNDRSSRNSKLLQISNHSSSKNLSIFIPGEKINRINEMGIKREINFTINKAIIRHKSDTTYHSTINPKLTMTYFEARSTRRGENSVKANEVSIVNSNLSNKKSLTKYASPKKRNIKSQSENKKSRAILLNTVNSPTKTKKVNISNVSEINISQEKSQLNTSSLLNKTEDKNTLKTLDSYSQEEMSPHISMEINSNVIKNLEYKNVKGIVKYKDKAVKVSDGALFLFRVYDKRRILRFSIESRRFKVIEFADFGDFEGNYNPQGSIYLNTLNGLFIVTGKNHDMFYYFSHKAKTMTKLAKLNDNHTFGSLLFFEQENLLICLSGWHNRKVEKYANDELISGYINKKPRSSFYKKENMTKNSWSYLPEMRVERSECPYMIINQVELFAFFGYCCPKETYISTIEKLNLSKPTQWEEIKIKNESHLSTQIKSHSAVVVKGNILFLGGFDGLHECPVEDFFEFDMSNYSLIPIERKYPDIIHNHFYNFQNDSVLVPYVDNKSRLHFAGFDENDRVHSIETSLLNYDIFKFDE